MDTFPKEATLKLKTTEQGDTSQVGGGRIEETVEGASVHGDQSEEKSENLKQSKEEKGAR